MPKMANITVKDDSNVDVVYLARSAASGDGVFAQWSTAGVTPALSATLRARASFNGSRDGRRVEMTGAFPYTQVSGGVDTLVALEPFSVSLTIPQNQPVANSVRNATVLGNLIASALIKEIMGSGYSAT